MNNEIRKVTRRELEIIWEISQGLSSEEISEKFFISVFTVQTHRRNVMQKVNARNTAHLIQLAHELGLMVPISKPYLGISKSIQGQVIFSTVA